MPRITHIVDCGFSFDGKDFKNLDELNAYLLSKEVKPEEVFAPDVDTEKIEKLKSLGYSDEDIKAAFKRKGIAEEKVNEILSQTKTEKDAIQEQGAGSVLQHPQEAVGETGSERSGVESGKQGEEAAGTRTEEKQQKEVSGEPPKEPPKTGEFSSLPQKERVRGAYQHLINSDIPKDIKEKMEKEGLSPKGTSISYKVAGNEESQKVGKATIQSFGVDEALNLARQGTFHPSVNSSVFAEAINHFQELESNAKTSAEKLDYAQKWADTYDEYAQQLTGAGQFSQYAYQYYKTSKLGFVISAERKFNDRRDYFTGKAEKNLKSIIEDIENEPEFQEYLKGKVADEYFKDKGVKNKVVAKLNDTAAKIRKEGLGSILPSWAKADVGGAQKQSIGGKTLDDIVATSLETIAKGIEAGEKIGDLVRDAISNIKSGGATANDKEISDWLYGQFKGTQKDATESYKERLRNQIKDLDEQITNKERKQKETKKTEYDDETKDLIKERDEKKKQLNEVVPLQKSAEKILQKWDKKLSNLDPEKRKELLQKVLTEITQNGGLDLDTFKSMYADALGLPSLTPEMRTKLLELGGRLNSVDKATEELSKNPTQENIDAYLKSMQDGEKASSEINDLFGEKGITLDRFLNIAKLNTLGVANLVMNPLYNINFMPVRFAESLVKTGLDYGLKYMGFARDADGVYENALYKQFGYYGGFKQGLQKSIHDVVRGQTQIDYFKKTTRQNIRPLTSLKELISHYKGENPLTKAEVVNAMVEAFPTMGASAAVISRALQVGDLPFRFAAERAMAENIARQKGLSGIEKDAFVLNPNEASKKLITDAGERAVMQQDNELTKLITRLSSAFKYAGGESRATKVLSGIGKVIGATTQPFVKIPLNSAMSVLELAVPEFSAAKGIYHAINGERDLALNAFSRMAVGIAIGAAYSQIAQAGLISSTSNSPDKINASIAKEDVYGGNDLNYSAFLRWMSGGGAGWKNDDTFLNLNAFGVSGNIMALYGAKYDKMPPDQWNKLSYLDGLSNRVSSSFIDGLKNNVFSNTSTLIDAMSSGNAYSVNKWLRGSSNVLLNSFDPSWLSMASKLKNDFKVDYTAMSLKDQMASTLKERFWNKDDLPKQITVWGEDRKLTPNGANPLLYYYADVTKSRRLDSRDFGYNILSLYNRTKDDSVIPSRPQKTIRQDNQSKQLNPKEYEQLQVLVGQSRKAQAQAMMAGQFQNEEGDMVSFSDLNDEQKIKILDKTYSKGYEIGKKQFLIKNPGFFQNDKK